MKLKTLLFALSAAAIVSDDEGWHDTRPEQSTPC